MIKRRSREIGIRMALGAMAGNVMRPAMREVRALVGIGIGGECRPRSPFAVGGATGFDPVRALRYE
jgi:hypothetical protein